MNENINKLIDNAFIFFKIVNFSTYVSSNRGYFNNFEHYYIQSRDTNF